MNKTALHEQHIKAHAKMGPFAGYDMPLYYDEGVMKEHEWVRDQAGIFDVSHMGQVTIKGKGAREFIERITPSSFEKAPDGRAKYTVMTNARGGIVDDLIITKRGADEYFAVINAGCKDKDIAWMESHLADGLEFIRHDDRALIALQGPKAESVLRDVFHIDVEGMPYMWLIEAQLTDGTKIFVSRLGYTGEDGFELSVPERAAPGVWTNLIHHGAVKPIGLAARDSLRLEMGYCLYGHDIDDTTTPVEAGLSWVIGKSNTGFIGADVVLPQRENGAERMRAGVKLTDKGVAREGAIILNENEEQIGTFTSGGFSPSLKEAIGQGYVPTEYAKAGTKILVDVRGRKIPAVIADMPFMPAKTKSMKQAA